MKIAYITAGAGENYRCDNCLRDAALLRALSQAGHQVLAVPLYLPAYVEQPGQAVVAPMFFGGINVYLQQKLALFRRTPRWIDRLFDSPTLLRWLSRRSSMTRPADLANTLLSMLAGRDGRQAKELQRLMDFLSLQRHDVVVLSNALLSGLACPIARELRLPVVCLLQDEDGFVEGLGESYSAEAWSELARCCRDVRAFIAPSHAYAETMAGRLNLPPDAVHVVDLGAQGDELPLAAAAMSNIFQAAAMEAAT
ncbi:MAG: glycosyltransferase family 4 protein [Planctomycetaceae bacterium]|nr:glycosyltransferase family 4 protein [Planctomycetaceae bacterium]